MDNHRDAVVTVIWPHENKLDPDAQLRDLGKSLRYRVSRRSFFGIISVK